MHFDLRSCFCNIISIVLTFLFFPFFCSLFLIFLLWFTIVMVFGCSTCWLRGGSFGWAGLALLGTCNPPFCVSLSCWVTCEFPDLSAMLPVPLLSRVGVLWPDFSIFRSLETPVSNMATTWRRECV